MIFPVGVDYQTRRYPAVMFTIMGLCVLVFLPAFVMSFTARGEDSLEWYARMMLTPAESGIFAWITHMFIHAGFFHILGNMAYLFLFGSAVEDTLGRGWFTGFYLVSGVVAALVQIICSSEGFSSEVPLCGASGAISACMGAFVLMQPKAGVQMGYFFLIFLRPVYGTFSLPGWLVISFWFLLDVIGLFGDLRGGGGEVAFGAHVGGFVFGMAALAVMRVAFKNRFPGHRDDEEGEVESAEIVSRHRALKPASSEQPADILLWEGGQQIGPYSAATVAAMVEAGSLDVETCLYWKEGMGDWKLIREWGGV